MYKNVKIMRLYENEKIIKYFDPRRSCDKKVNNITEPFMGDVFINKLHWYLPQHNYIRLRSDHLMCLQFRLQENNIRQVYKSYEIFNE